MMSASLWVGIVADERQPRSKPVTAIEGIADGRGHVQKCEPRLHFIPPMECLSVRDIAEGPEWQYELKLDGYRAIVIKQGDEARMFSRNGAELTHLGSLNSALLDLPGKSCIL